MLLTLSHLDTILQPKSMQFIQDTVLRMEIQWFKSGEKTSLTLRKTLGVHLALSQ